MKQKAIVIAEGHLESVNGKTAHGLVRKCERYNIVGVIDSQNAGNDLTHIIQKAQPLPIFGSVAEAVQGLGYKPDICITGVATHGGRIPEDLKKFFFEALNAGISIVNGLHEFVSDHADLKALADKNGAHIVDIRKPRPNKDLRFWNGEIFSVQCPIIAVMGTDCAVGKRTTTQWLLDSCKAKGVKAEMIYTGQTGWLQGAKYGFIFDVTPNDFVSGELEGAIVECSKNENPDIILIEGQSSLRNPSGPCGSEFILSGNAKSVILQHAPKRKYFEGFEELKLPIPSLENEIQLIRHLGAEVIAVSLNTENMEEAEINSEKEKLAKQTDIPVFSLVHDGCEALTDIVAQRAGKKK